MAAGVVTDLSGNPSGRSIVVDSVVMIDITAPKQIVPEGTIPAAAEPDSDTARVSFATSGTDTIDGELPVACAPASGSALPLGDTTVTFTATDSAGNTTVATFVVAVNAAAPQPTATTPTTTTAPSSTLPATGGDTDGPVSAVALTLILTGASQLAIRRRHAHRFSR